jgi:hypothetical protein
MLINVLIFNLQDFSQFGADGNFLMEPSIKSL